MARLWNRLTNTGDIPLSVPCSFMHIYPSILDAVVGSFSRFVNRLLLILIVSQASRAPTQV